MAEKLLIFGNTGGAEMMFYNFTSDPAYEIVGFTVDEPYIIEKELCGLPVFPFMGIDSRFPPADHLIFIAIGYSRLNQLRAEKYSAAKALGYRFASYISPRAHIGYGCMLGDNCMIGANCSLQPLVKVGNNTVIRENVFIGSGTEIQDHCYISGASAIAGHVTVGMGTFIGLNATVKDNISLGRECIIGAGVTLLHEIKDREVYLDNSSRKLPFSSDRIKI
jgi:sugar O-acyltransferase (sialic acid O-acetyltransferase NeuD family)